MITHWRAAANQRSIHNHGKFLSLKNWIFYNFVRLSLHLSFLSFQRIFLDQLCNTDELVFSIIPYLSRNWKSCLSDVKNPVFSLKSLEHRWFLIFEIHFSLTPGFSFLGDAWIFTKILFFGKFSETRYPLLVIHTTRHGPSRRGRCSP